MSRILVTGGAGAIGSRLVATLCGEGHDVLVLDDLSSGFSENLYDLSVRFWRGSVVDEEILKEVFAERPEAVLHLAANFANQNSVDYPQKDLLVNGMGTLKVLQHAVDTGVRRFVYASSSCVYGNADAALSELRREYSLDTPYAITKLVGEQYVNFFHEHHALATVVLRFFNSYGPGEYPGRYRNVIPNFMLRAMRAEPLVITGTGHETRDFTYVDDTVRAVLRAMNSDAAVGQTINVGSGRETPIQGLAEAIVAVTGGRSAIEYKPRRGWDSVNRRVADISKARALLGFEPATELAEGLARTHDWFVARAIAARRLSL